MKAKLTLEMEMAQPKIRRVARRRRRVARERRRAARERKRVVRERRSDC